MLTRRHFNQALLLTPLVPLLARAASPSTDSLKQHLAALERRSAGRLGVAALDSATGHSFGWRQEERFPMCSTFKVLLCAAVLAKVDTGAETLQRRLVYRRETLPEYSPVSAKHAGAPGLSIGELCEAAITLSDNGAANLLLETLGGPGGLTAWVRQSGDAVSRLDRAEPELNSALAGDDRDTTSPAAMLASLQRLLLGQTLSPGSRSQLADWMIANRTGAATLRAGLPSGWKVGDKTGSGEHGTRNDVAIVWPPHRSPWLVSAYLTGSPAEPAERDAVLAEVGRLTTAALMA
ncbi:MAG: Beta-lactamase SHV-1 [Pseudomonas citronellolis]|nr:MAG: Beta-lactamase SHV-1 [Pseudomonas citronellolis]